MGVTLTSPRPAHGSLNWDTTLEADLTALASGINNTVAIDGTDANAITKAGVYIGNTLGHSPGGSTGTFWIWVNWLNVGSQAQIALDYTTGALWSRKSQSGTWSAWRQVVDSSSDTGWIVASTGITAASGWTLNSAKYRNNNGVVSIYLNLTRTGAAITANAAGIITASNVAVLPAGLIPAQSNGVLSAVGASSTVAASGFAGSGGNVTVSNVAPSQSIATNGVLEMVGTYLL